MSTLRQVVVLSAYLSTAVGRNDTLVNLSAWIAAFLEHSNIAEIERNRLDLNDHIIALELFWQLLVVMLDQMQWVRRWVGASPGFASSRVRHGLKR